jgi:hypothetical protein
MTRAFSITVLIMVLSGSAAGCAPGEMHPGESCGQCHGSGDAPSFGAAGTVHPAGADDGLADVSIDITDSSGRSVSLVSNDVGNFYTTRALTPPLQVTLSRAGGPSVSATVPGGDCNGCHRDGSSPGRLSVP